MKKTSIFSLTILMILLTVMLLTVPAGANYNRTYTATKGTPKIDGEIDAVWANAEWTTVDKPYDGKAYNYPEALKIKLLWDDTYIYFLAEVTDSDFNEDNDLVELYLDEGMERAAAYDKNDSQTRFRWNGTVIQNSGTNCQNNAPGAGKKTSTGWVTEGALKWTMTHKTGNKLGLEFMLNIGDSKTAFTNALRWNVNTAGGDPAPFQNTSAFGTLILADAKPAATAAATTTTAPAATTAAKAATAPQTGDSSVWFAVLPIMTAVMFAFVLHSKKTIKSIER